MPLTRIAADAFGVVTITLVSLTAVLGLVCIYRSLYFLLQIRQRGFPQLNYFNGPWITRIALILVAIWWGFGEIFRLTFLREQGRHFSSRPWQKNLCKFYIISNLGFAEPSMFLMVAFLLHAALQKRNSGTLSPRWNRRTLFYALLSCLPVFIMQFLLVLVGPKFDNEESGKRTKKSKFFTWTYTSTRDSSVCTYPLLSTVVLGLFYAILIVSVIYIGHRLLSLVINKGLRRRVLLMSSIIVFLLLRVFLLGFSILPNPDSLVYEAIVFLAFLALLFSIMVGICMLVYLPVSDSLALRDIGNREIEGMPYDDYYHDGASLIANNKSRQEASRNSDATTKQDSISFRTMIRDESPQTEGIDDLRFFPHGSLHIGSPSGSPPLPGRPMVPLMEVLTH